MKIDFANFRFSRPPDPRLASIIDKCMVDHRLLGVADRILPILKEGGVYSVDAFYLPHERKIRLELTTSNGVLLWKQSIFHDGGEGPVDLEFFEDIVMQTAINAARDEKIDWLRSFYNLIAEKYIHRYVEIIKEQTENLKYDSPTTKEILRLYLIKKLDHEKIALDVTTIAVDMLEKIRDRRKAEIARCAAPPDVKVGLEPGKAETDDPRGYERWDPSSWLQ